MISELSFDIHCLIHKREPYKCFKETFIEKRIKHQSFCFERSEDILRRYL